SLETPLEEFARVFKAEHRIEECLQRAKSEAGLADYQVRTWEGWHHHQSLSLLATWFPTQETRRGKKADAGIDRAPGGGGDWPATGSTAGLQSTGTNPAEHDPPAATKRGGSVLLLEATQ